MAASPTQGEREREREENLSFLNGGYIEPAGRTSQVNHQFWISGEAEMMQSVLYSSLSVLPLKSI